MKKVFRVVKVGARQLAVAGAAVALPVLALAQSAPTSGTDALNQISSGQSAYGTAMYGLAFAAVGILVAVKWIKRGRGAA